MSDLASLVVRLEADASMYLKEMDKATKALKQFQKDQESLAAKVGDYLKGIAGQVAAAFAVEAVVSFSMAAIEAQAALAQFSQVAGVSVETLSAFGIVAAGVGISQEDLVQSFKKLNEATSEAAGDSTSKAGIAYKLLGINVRDANGNIKDAATLNDEIADSFQRSADGANKDAIARALYGKNYQAMLILLNEGSKAFHEQEDAARAAGATLSGPAAEAAEAFERKLNTLEATVKGQLSNAISTALVPALTDLLDAFKMAGENGQAFATVASGIATGFKIVASVIAEVSRELEVVYGYGRQVGAAFAAMAQAAKGNWSAARDIIKEAEADVAATSAKYSDIRRKIWSGDAQAQADAAKLGATDADKNAKPKADLGSLAGGEASAAAVKKLQEFANGLKEQAAAFGLGEAAAVRYKLTIGSLADDVKKAGAAGDEFVKSAERQAAILQSKKDTKSSGDMVKALREQIAALDQSDVAAYKYKITSGEIGDMFNRMGAAGKAAQAVLIGLDNQLIDDKDKKAVQALNDEIAKTKGLLVESGVAAFDLQNKSLKQNATDRGDAGALAAIQNRRDQIQVLDQFNQLVAKSEAIEKDFADQEASLTLKSKNQSISDIDYQKQMDVLRANELNQLGQIHAAEQAIADGAGKDIPEIINKTKDLDKTMQNLGSDMDKTTKQIRDGMESAFANNFSDLITGAKTFHQAVMGFLKDIEKQMADMVAKDFAQNLFGANGAAGGAPGMLASLFGGGGGSSGGGLLSSLSGLFGGGGSGIASTGAAAAGTNASDLASSIAVDLPGFATGGTMSPGSYAMVGENGPEVAYAGSQNLHIQPMSSAQKSVTQNNNFNISAPGGTISRQSQSQVAAAAARQVGAATRRRSA